MAKRTTQFLQMWGVKHATGIPHSPTGQAIVEQTHRSLKDMLHKQKRGSLGLDSPQERLWKATYILSFLNHNDKDQM